MIHQASRHQRHHARCPYKPGFAIWPDLHPASLPLNPDQDSLISGSALCDPSSRPFSWHQCPDCASFDTKSLVNTTLERLPLVVDSTRCQTVCPIMSDTMPVARCARG